MSVKDVKNYYDQITEDYIEMIDSLKEMEELAKNKIVSPEKIEELKNAVEPLKTNYQRISWIMYLLNQPNKKEKIKKYQKVMKPKMANIDPNNTGTLEAVAEENKKIISTANETWANNLN